MGSMTIVLSFFAVLLVINYSEAGPDGCPLASKIYGCTPKCQQNYDCSQGKKCCPNACNAKSCVDVAAYGGNNSGKDKNQSGGAGVYCGNQKCSPFEVCKLDPATKRMKCSRA